jgi:hypothetical protein
MTFAKRFSIMMGPFLFVLLSVSSNVYSQLKPSKEFLAGNKIGYSYFMV